MSRSVGIERLVWVGNVEVGRLSVSTCRQPLSEILRPCEVACLLGLGHRPLEAAVLFHVRFKLEYLPPCNAGRCGGMPENPRGFRLCCCNVITAIGIREPSVRRGAAPIV